MRRIDPWRLAGLRDQRAADKSRLQVTEPDVRHASPRGGKRSTSKRTTTPATAPRAAPAAWASGASTALSAPQATR